MILGNASDISSGRVPIVYHRNCRSSYCSAYHIQRVVSKRNFSGVESSGDAGSANDDNALFTRSRSSTPTFDWKISCFICGEQCNPKHRSTWSMVEVAVQHEPGAQNMYTKMVVAARRRCDQTMLTRLYAVTNGDLVAVEARYHRQKGCYSHYISEKHIYAHQADVTAESTYKEVIRSLVDEFLPAIIDEKQVFYLTMLKSRFQELLLGTEIDNPHAYKSYNLKKQLLQECPNLAFISQPGMSDFVCSNDISVGDALKKVSELVSVIKELSDEQQGLDSAERSCVSEESIVHTAVGILRRRLHKSKYQTENYYSSEEMNIESLKDFVDPLLYKAVGWLTDGKLYSEATDIRETDSLQCLSIACDITTLATSVASPKHLGLAVDLHHSFGSRKLVECISALGYCISYSELRRFLTSAAIHVSSIQTSPAGCFIPPQLVSKSDGGKIVIGVGDNWDHNEWTVDGKRTTHAMTSILVSPTVDTDKSSPTISRAASRSLDIHSITGGDLSLVLPYRKPTERPEPVLQPPPTADDLELNQNDIEYNGACTTEMLYNILRSGDFGDFAIPPWAQYHNCISTDRTPQSVSTVAFNPIIMAPPNDYATIYTTLMRFKDVSSTLGHSQIPVCFDMGLLTKALEIVWAHPKELPGVISFEGGMHFLLSVFSGIGFLYGDAGLRQLLQDSCVFAVGTTQQILSGRDFDRTMYALKLVDEVLNSRFLHQFSKWCEKKGIMPSNELCDMLQGIADYLSLTESSVISTDMLNQTQEFVKLHLNQLLEEFRTEGRTSSPTFRLWDDFLTKVMLPFKTFITSTKNAQWSVYQASKSKLLPLLFASNRTNYARYLPVLLLMMQRLPSEVKDAFENGLFVAKLTDGRFNGVWMDYTLEATENKALKGNGGIIGLTLRGTALTRWFLARPVTAIYSTNFSGMLTNKHRVAQQQNPGKLMSKSEVNRWNADVIKMKQMFDGTFSDPFSLNDPPLHLINFATGCVALPAVEESLIGALDKGLSMASTFIRDRLVPEQDGERPKKSFYAPLTRSNVKTMVVMNKTVKLSTQNISINGEVMYLRLLAVNATKQVPLQRLLSFENLSVPLSLFSEDGSPLSCVKSLFMHKLEGLLAEDKLTFVAGSDAIIFDGHAIIQMLPGPSGTEKVTFKDMASHFIRYILHVSEQHGTIKQIHVAFDRYDLESIKNIVKNTMCNLIFKLLVIGMCF